MIWKQLLRGLFSSDAPCRWIWFVPFLPGWSIIWIIMITFDYSLLQVCTAAEAYFICSSGKNIKKNSLMTTSANGWVKKCEMVRSVHTNITTSVIIRNNLWHKGAMDNPWMVTMLVFLPSKFDFSNTEGLIKSTISMFQTYFVVTRKVQAFSVIISVIISENIS